jgi:integrase
MAAHYGGRPDRRHVRGKTRAEITKKFGNSKRARQRQSSQCRPGLDCRAVVDHWPDNIAAHSVRYKTLVGYRTDVIRHLIPEIGAHRITKLETRTHRKAVQQDAAKSIRL